MLLQDEMLILCGGPPVCPPTDNGRKALRPETRAWFSSTVFLPYQQRPQHAHEQIGSPGGQNRADHAN